MRIQHPAEHTSARQGSGAIRVLVVEDNPIDAELIVRELDRAGLETQWERVESEPEFVERLSPEIDLILSDYSLPQFNGLDALAIVRSRGLETPFILVSGTIGEEIAVAAMRGGADDYLLKDRIARLGPAVLQALSNRRLQHENRRVQASLRESEERFRQIAESIREVFWLGDFAARALLYVSPGYELVWQRPCATLQCWPALQLDALHPEDRSRIRHALAEHADAGAYDLQYRVVRPDGTIRWIHDRAFPVRDAAGALYRVAGVAEDITEQHQAQHKIRGLNRVHAMLSGINNAIVHAAEPAALYREACRIAVEHGRFGLAWIGEHDAARERIVPVAAAGLDADARFARTAVSVRPEAAEAGSLAARALRSGQPVFDNDLSANPDAGGEARREAIRRGYRSGIALPLAVDGSVVATFSLVAAEAGFFHAEERRLLSELAANIGFALGHIARQRKLAKLSRIRMVSGRVNAAIVRIHDRDALLEESGRIAAQDGRFPFVWVGWVERAQRTLRCVSYAGFSEPLARALPWPEPGASADVLAQALQDGTRAVRNALEPQPGLSALTQEALRAGCGSAVCLPLRLDGEVVAAAALFAQERDFFDAEELALLDEVAADVSFALRSIAGHEKVAYLSYYDLLTGLPNRILFADRAQNQIRAREGKRPLVALVLLNVERFRIINESFGRNGGDALLQLIGRRLEDAMRGKEHIARAGSDTFAVLMRGMRDSSAVVHALEQQLLGAFEQPFRLDGRELRVSARAGIALYPGDGEQADVLFNNAEAALKRARALNERYLFYSADMNSEAAHLLALETRLRAAVDRGQFVLHYQPKVALGSGQIAGLEALIRWDDPDNGLVPPGRFVPLLEETGLILEVGKWALRQALADHRRLQDLGLQAPRISVNVSAIQLRRADFVDTVLQAVQDEGDRPEALELEITESLLMQNVQRSIRSLTILRGLGIPVAMDDFGTGYSSLSYIARLPIDSLKIDRSFVHAMMTSHQDKSIVATVLALARALDLKVVAEGVETDEQCRALRGLGCDQAQGYLFSRPVPFDTIAALLQAQGDGERNSSSPLPLRR